MIKSVNNIVLEINIIIDSLISVEDIIINDFVDKL